MPTRRLTVLDVWILCWLDGEARRSQGLLAASAQKLFEGLARQDQQQICANLAWLETNGLIVVGRVAGKRPAYLSLTAAGAQRVHPVPRRWDM